MLIGGFQKTSLIDYPGCISSVIFTRGCNFRCPYCHNPELVYPEQYTDLLDEDGVLSYLANHKKDAVVITGGEPTLQEDILPFAKLLKDMGYLVKLDTNGSRPDVLQLLITERVLDYVALDIKAPKWKYKKTTQIGYNAYTLVMQSKHMILDSGLPYEFRTVFDRNLLKEEDIEEIRKSLPKDANYMVKGTFQQSV